MWALLARVLGPLIGKAITREAAEEILKKYGMNFLRNFVKKAGPDLANLSKDDILNLAQAEFSKQTGKLFQDKIFTRSRAKQLAAIVNKKIDWIEEITKRWASRQVVGSKATFLGIDITGGPPVFEKIATRSQKINKLVDATLGPLIMPYTRKQAFAGGYFRGLTGETLARAINRAIEALVGIPRVAAQSPKYRTFLRTLMGEVKYLRSVGEVKSATKLWNALRIAYQQANKPLVGFEDHLISFGIAGNISGRVTVPIATTYIFVDNEERQRNVAKFKKTVLPFAKKKVKTYVNAYVKDDGTRVKGHYRTYEMAAY